MKYKEDNIKNGIKLHMIKTEKFKTNLIAIMLTIKLEKEKVTKNALIPMILKRGTTQMKTQEEINKKMEGMYGASFDCGLDKTGDNQILKFYIETVNDEFLPTDSENMLKEAIQKIFEIVLNPYLENGNFKREYVEQEKENLKQIIEGKIDNKARYALDRCIEEMYKDEPFGLYKYGNIEDLKNINEKNLYEYYLDLIKNCKIDILVSGIIDDSTEKLIKENENIKKLQERDAQYENYKMPEANKKQENEIQESMDITQGKLILGLDVDMDKEQLKYAAMIYNSILGGSANSKLFQNVREKASLAYTASSSYMRLKNNIFINCGIEIENYQKALNIIKKQIEDMKKGDFTEEELKNAKKGIIAAIKGIDDEQDSEITYFFGQEFSNVKVSLDGYIEKVNNVTKKDVLDIANKIKINTIYFLKN